MIIMAKPKLPTIYVSKIYILQYLLSILKFSKKNKITIFGMNIGFISNHILFSHEQEPYTI